MFDLCLFHIFVVVRDLDGYVYFREHEGCIVAGGFVPVAKPAYGDGKIPSKFFVISFIIIILL